MKAQDIISRGVQTVSNKDETFSTTGRKDFEKPDQGDVRTITANPVPSRLRTRNSENNSYT